MTWEGVVGEAVKRFIIIAAMTAIPLAAWAQNTQVLRDRDRDLAGAKRVVGEIQQANIHSGPFYLWSRIRLSDAGFTEDVYLPTGEARGGINLRVEAPNRFYFVPHRKTVFTIDAVPGYTFLNRGDRSGQFDYRLRGDAHFLLNHLYLDAYMNLTDQLRAQVADINRLATQRERESGLGGELKYSSRTSMFFSGNYREVKFPTNRLQPKDVPQITLLDRIERNGRLSLHHKTFPLTSLFVAAEASTYGFRRATYKDSSRRYAGAGFIRASGRTSLRVEAGRTRLDFDDPTERDYSGITGEIGIGRSNGRWNTTLTGQRDIGFSIFGDPVTLQNDNNYYISTAGSLQVQYSATRKLNLRGGLTAERDNYDVPVHGLLREDILTYSYVGFIYSFRRLALGADLGWFTRESNFLGDDSGIRWVLHLSFTP
jgi:hypothetical protein